MSNDSDYKLPKEEKNKEKVKKKAKVFTKILEWYVIISAIIITLLLVALIGKGLYWVFANLFHGLASVFS